MDPDPRAIDLVKVSAARAAAELKRKRAEAELQTALEQVRALQKKLEAENVYLQEEITKEHNFEEIVGSSKAIVEALDRVATVAPPGHRRAPASRHQTHNGASYMRRRILGGYAFAAQIAPVVGE